MLFVVEGCVSWVVWDWMDCIVMLFVWIEVMFDFVDEDDVDSDVVVFVGV